MTQIVARPNPFKSDLVRFEAEPGICLAGLIVMAMERAGEPVRTAANACVTVDELKIEKDRWLEVIPPPSSTVVINALPGDDIGGLLVSIATFALAAWVPPIGSLAIAGVNVGQLAVRAGIALVGSLVAQAIAPTPRQTLTNQADPITPASYSITGIRNEARPYGTIPMVYGRLVNFHPPLAAVPYTDAINAYGDQYLHMVFGWMGQCAVSNLKFGDTPVGQLRNISYETLSGAQGDSSLTLYPRQVREDTLNIKLQQINGYTTRTSEPDTDEIVVEVLFPNGMGRVTDRNEKLSIRVAFRVTYSGNGVASGTPAPITSNDNQYSLYIEGDGTFAVQGYTKTAVRRSVRFRPPSRGQYTISIARITVDDQSDTSGDNQSTTFEDSYLVSFKSIRYDTPLTQEGLALVAIRAQANEQLNGVIDNFNCTVQRYLPVWNGSIWSAPQATRNPAWAFVDVLKGAGNVRPLTDDRIDLDTILTWANACSAAGITFDAVLTERASVWEVLQEIASAGFASLTIRDGKYSVIHDTTRSTPVQHFSERNSWNFNVTRMFGDLPHALTVRFPNEATLHQTDEVTVYDDGYDENTATRLESLDLPYTTSASLAWKAGRRYMATARLRPRIISIDTDIEFLICERGDLVRISHNVMLVGLGSARVKSITTNGSGDLTAVELDAPFDMSADTDYCLRFRKSTNVSVYATLATVAGSSASFTISPAIASGQPMPEVGDLAFFGLAGSETIECIIRSIEPRPDLSATITLVDYSPDIFTADSGDIPDFDPGITLRPTIQRKAPPKPVILSVDSDERALIRLPNGTFIPRVLIAYELRPTENELPPQNIQVRWRSSIEAGDPQFRMVPVQTGTVAIEPVEEGDTIIIEMRSISEFGATSEWVSVTHTVIGRTSKPPAVERFYRAGDTLVWPYPNPPADLAGFILRAHYGTNTTWSTARALHPGVWPTSPFDISALSGQQTILIKAVDTSGNESDDAVSVTMDLGDLPISNIVLTQSEGPGFSGTLSGGTDTGTQLEASVLSDVPFYGDADAPFYGNAADPIYAGTVYSEMSYIAEYTPDPTYLDGILRLDLTVTGEYTVDYRIATSPAFYGSGAAAFYGAAGDPFYDASEVGEWTPWPGQLGPFESDDYTYQIRITTKQGSTQGIISKFDLITDVADVEEDLDDVVIAATSTRLPITKTFREIFTVQMTVQADGNGGISARILDKDASLGPDVEVLNAAGTAVIGLVDAKVKGI